ncbi:MAG: CCA tRNA nucleotidyltransferase [Firmicutes bacterium]|nr:CCA tRNA nucleotidyltransferase [Bacillota bacterium]
MDEPVRGAFPPEIADLLEEIAAWCCAEGIRAALVGGSVRNLLLGLKMGGDLDLAVEGDAEALGSYLARARGGESIPHPAFGTCTVEIPEIGRVDLASTRTEIYPSPGDLPRVRPARLEDDLLRRDFSVNAMALPLKKGGGTGNLVDPCGGAGDLDARVLKVLHPQSFSDDPTRLFRGVRLAARLGFRLDKQTGILFREALRGGYLDPVSGERVFRELCLAAAESAAARVFTAFAKHGLLAASFRTARIFKGVESRFARVQDILEPHLWIRAGDARRPSRTPEPVLAFLATALWPCEMETAWAAAERLSLSRGRREKLVCVLNEGRKILRGLRRPNVSPDRREELLEAWPPEGLAVLAAVGGEQITEQIREHLRRR